MSRKDAAPCACVAELSVKRAADCCRLTKPLHTGGKTDERRRARCRNSQARGDRVPRLLPAQPADRSVRRARHPSHPVPAGASRRRHGRRLYPHQARQAQRRVRGAGGSGDRERLSRHRPGLFRERAAAGHPGRAAAGTAIRAADVPRRRCLSAGHQVVGAGAYGRGTAGRCCVAPITPCAAARAGRF